MREREWYTYKEVWDRPFTSVSALLEGSVQEKESPIQANVFVALSPNISGGRAQCMALLIYECEHYGCTVRVYCTGVRYVCANPCSNIAVSRQKGSPLAESRQES